MGLIVKKFGGTSVADLEKIELIADKIAAKYKAGNKLVIVLSAMAGETDRLEAMAYQITKQPNSREFDVLLSTGEQVTIALLAIALLKRGCPARSYTGAQLNIRTNDVHTKARIVSIDKDKILSAVTAGQIVIVAGFQGVDYKGDVTTLGRGGSDTTAVAIAAAIKADECQIYTDVEGVYTTDPKIVNTANRIDKITFDEMLEFSSLGAKVLQVQAVEFASKYGMPLRVLSTFTEGDGTLISYESSNKKISGQVVSGIAFSRNEAKIIIRNIPNYSDFTGKLLDSLSIANITVDMIMHNLTDLTFVVHREDFSLTMQIITPIVKALELPEILTNVKISKLSVIGVGMSYAGIASKIFKVLGQKSVNIQLVSTTEIKVSVILDEKYLELGVRALHEAFGLGKNLSETLTYKQYQCEI